MAFNCFMFYIIAMAPEKPEPNIPDANDLPQTRMMENE